MTYISKTFTKEEAAKDFIRAYLLTYPVKIYGTELSCHEMIDENSTYWLVSGWRYDGKEN